MTEKTYNVLFICTGNSARSIIAEGLMNELGRGRFRAYSAGSCPKGTVNPLALKALGPLQTSAEGFRSKSWEEFVRPDAPLFDFVFTVCDDAAGEVCPAWPGQPITAHWGVPDPAAFEGPDDEKAQQFFDVAVVLRHRIELLMSLPLHSLDALSLHRELKDIGER